MSFTAANLTFPSTMAPVACVDIGGTKVAVSVADAQGVRGKLAEPTATVGDRGALADQIIRMVAQSCASAGVAVAELSAVGVAVWAWAATPASVFAATCVMGWLLLALAAIATAACTSIVFFKAYFFRSQPPKAFGSPAFG